LRVTVQAFSSSSLGPGKLDASVGSVRRVFALEVRGAFSGGVASIAVPGSPERTVILGGGLTCRGGPIEIVIREDGIEECASGIDNETGWATVFRVSPTGAHGVGGGVRRVTGEASAGNGDCGALTVRRAVSGTRSGETFGARRTGGGESELTHTSPWAGSATLSVTWLAERSIVEDAMSAVRTLAIGLVVSHKAKVMPKASCRTVRRRCGIRLPRQVAVN
jgi:hypothetical protein